jgi:hypothetical protein
MKDHATIVTRRWCSHGSDPRLSPWGECGGRGRQVEIDMLQISVRAVARVPAWLLWLIPRSLLWDRSTKNIQTGTASRPMICGGSIRSSKDCGRFSVAWMTIWRFLMVWTLCIGLEARDWGTSSYEICFDRRQWSSDSDIGCRAALRGSSEKCTRWIHCFFASVHYQIQCRCHDC